MLAITLNRQDFREFDQRIIFYTREAGKLEVIARGVKKSLAKNAAALEPFAVIEVEVVPGREMMYAVRAYPVEMFPRIRLDFEKLIPASFALRAAENATETGVPDENIFKLLRSGLAFLDVMEKPGRNFADVFLLRLWSLLGFAPVFDRCAACGKGGKLTGVFDVKEGGILCDLCRKTSKNGIRFNADLLERFKKIIFGNWAEFAKIDFTEKEGRGIHLIIKKFIEFRSGKRVLEVEKFFS